MFHAGKNQGDLLKQDIDAPKQPNCETYYLLISRSHRGPHHSRSNFARYELRSTFGFYAPIEGAIFNQSLEAL